MNGVKQIARLVSLLTLTLWFALSFGTAFASGQAANAPAADHAVVAESGHGTDAGSTDAQGGHVVPNSLSAEKLKDLGWRVVNFIALMIILVKFGAKPIGSGLSARRKKIKDEIETLEQNRAEAETSYNEFQAKLATVESEIDKVVERAIAQAEVEKTKILEKAEQGAADLMRSAEMAVQNQVTEARRTLKNEVAEQAAVIAEELIVKNLTVDDQVKIIETYLDKVGAVQ
ncbi:MAG: ATP synthase F0 subunit B [Desulfobulbaceae bacterium]|nr:ATP synthase F0 subunit B [Desulfobulbaceae bacterium]